jgi:hypothetical protein
MLLSDAVAAAFDRPGDEQLASSNTAAEQPAQSSRDTPSACSDVSVDKRFQSIAVPDAVPVKNASLEQSVRLLAMQLQLLQA